MARFDEISERIDGWVIEPWHSCHQLLEDARELRDMTSRHLVLIRKLSMDEHTQADVAELRAQAAALIAEVGTLRARLRDECPNCSAPRGLIGCSECDAMLCASCVHRHEHTEAADEHRRR